VSALKRFAAVLLSLVGFSCSQPTPELIEGGLYATPQESGGFAVLKVLKIDEGGVHVRLYSNRFAELPTSLDESSLYMAGQNRAPDEELGMGHAPISSASFASWGARFVQQSSVAEDELEGYQIWLEAEGGYF